MATISCIPGVVVPLVSALVFLQGPTVRPGPAPGNPFVGAWKLISIERRAADGALIPGINPVGGVNPSGTVLYDDKGHVSLQIMPGGPRGTVNTLQPLTPDQAQAALFGYVAYFGTYTLDTAARVMNLHFDGFLNPSMVGTNGQRFYQFDGNRMTFRAGTSPATFLTWERME